MADQITPPLAKPVEKSAEQFEQEMAQTREAITDKVVALEHQVVGSVQSAADTLTSTVDAVKSFISDAPSAVTQTVKQATSVIRDSLADSFDISAKVRQNPWAALGGSFALGCLVGWLSSRERRSPAVAMPAYQPSPAAVPPVNEKPGVVEELVGMLGEKLKELAKTALTSATAAAKESIQEVTPQLVSEAASRITASEPVTPSRLPDWSDRNRVSV